MTERFQSIVIHDTASANVFTAAKVKLLYAFNYWFNKYLPFYLINMPTDLNLYSPCSILHTILYSFSYF